MQKDNHAAHEEVLALAGEANVKIAKLQAEVDMWEGKARNLATELVHQIDMGCQAEIGLNSRIKELEAEIKKGCFVQGPEKDIPLCCVVMGENQSLQAQLKEQEKTTAGKQECLESIAGCMVSQPRDFSLDHRDAWAYWILFGWDDAEQEIIDMHKWKGDTLSRLRRLRKQALTLPTPEAKGEECECTKFTFIMSNGSICWDVCDTCGKPPRKIHPEAKGEEGEVGRKPVSFLPDCKHRGEVDQMKYGCKNALSEYFNKACSKRCGKPKTNQDKGK